MHKVLLADKLHCIIGNSTPAKSGWSVEVFQPTSVIRAMNLIDSKGKLTDKLTKPWHAV